MSLSKYTLRLVVDLVGYVLLALLVFGLALLVVHDIHPAMPGLEKLWLTFITLSLCTCGTIFSLAAYMAWLEFRDRNRP